MSKNYINRLLHVPERSFILFGPRGVGKSTWLHEKFKDALYIDLLNASSFLELSVQPNRLEAMANTLPANSWIIIDEIQKLPALLDEVHRLIENRQWRFALCGSSARKLRRGGVNLLGGRAVTRNLAPFCSQELDKDFDLPFSLQWGLLPIVNNEKNNAADILSSYVNTYMKEEIKEEGLVRRVEPFIRFLNIAGILNGQIINAHNISREAAVARSTVDVYFSILEETLLAHFLPPYQPGIKVRERAHKKLYWFDPGVARAAAGLLHDPADKIWLGFALETLLYHEIRVYNHISQKNRSLFYYQNGSGPEIDFIIETKKGLYGKPPHVVCIEVKSSTSWNQFWEKPMRSIAQSPKIVVDKMIGVYTGDKKYHFGGVDVLPVNEFLDYLYKGNIF